MPLVLNNFTGFETGGLEEGSSISGSPDATEATTVRTGDRALLIPSGGTHIYALDMQLVADAGTDGAIFGFAFRAADVTPSAEDQFFDVLGGAQGGNLHLEADGDLVWKDAQATPVTQLTITSPFTANTWHYVELYIGSYSATTGSVEIFIDGTSAGSVSNVNTGTSRGIGSIFRSGGNGGNYYFDDAYILTGATAATQRLTGSSGTDEVHVKGYQSQLNSDTDNGDALEFSAANVWLSLGSLPFQDVNSETGYLSDNLAGSTDTDNGTRSGPSGDSDVSGGTIKGAKWVFEAKRTTGSDSSPFLRYGSTGGTTDAVDGTDITLATSHGIHEFLSESTNVPSTSQYFRLGMGKGAGGRDIIVADAIGNLLYTQAAGGAGGGTRRHNILDIGKPVRLAA